MLTSLLGCQYVRSLEWWNIMIAVSIIHREGGQMRSDFHDWGTDLAVKVTGDRAMLTGVLERTVYTCDCITWNTSLCTVLWRPLFLLTVSLVLFIADDFDLSIMKSFQIPMIKIARRETLAKLFSAKLPTPAAVNVSGNSESIDHTLQSAAAHVATCCAGHLLHHEASLPWRDADRSSTPVTRGRQASWSWDAPRWLSCGRGRGWLGPERNENENENMNVRMRTKRRLLLLQ